MIPGLALGLYDDVIISDFLRRLSMSILTYELESGNQNLVCISTEHAFIKKKAFTNIYYPSDKDLIFLVIFLIFGLATFPFSRRQFCSVFVLLPFVFFYLGI